MRLSKPKGTFGELAANGNKGRKKGRLTQRIQNSSCNAGSQLMHL